MYSYVAVSAVHQTWKHFTEDEIVKEFEFSETDRLFLQSGCFMVPESGVEILRKDLLKFVDVTKIRNLLYEKLDEGYDILSVGPIRTLLHLVAYASIAGIPWPQDYLKWKSFVVGRFEPGKAFLTVEGCYIAGRANG